MRLWSCPKDLHPAIRAPERLPKDDARRLCLDCTKASKKHKVVLRVCRSAEKENQRRKDQSATKRAARARTAAATRARLKKQHEARTLARYTVPGLGDLREELGRLEGLLFVRRAYEDAALGPCPLTVRRRPAGKHCSGVAYFAHRIAITIPEDCDRAQAVTILTHELAHRVVPNSEGHGVSWRNAHLRLIKEGYGVDLLYPQTNDRPAAIGVAYQAIEGQLAVAFAEKAVAS